MVYVLYTLYKIEYIFCGSGTKNITHKVNILCCSDTKWVLQMPARGWKNINLPEDMLEEMSIFIARPEVKAKYGFGTTAEFARRAISSYMIQIERELAIGTDYMLTAEEHRKRDQEEKEKKKDG